MPGVVTPAFKSLATAMATARQKQSPILDPARDRRVDPALRDSPEKRKRDERLGIISDPVVLARVHSRLWESGEKYHQWLSSYQKNELNPAALPHP